MNRQLEKVAAWLFFSKDLQNVFFELFYVYLERTHPNPEKSSPLKSQRGQKVAFHLLFIQATDMRITSRRKTFLFCFHRKLMLPSGVPKIRHTMLFLPNSFCNQQDEPMCSWTPESITWGSRSRFGERATCATVTSKAGRTGLAGVTCWLCSAADRTCGDPISRDSYSQICLSE